MKIECLMEKRTSQKGNDYYCLFIPELEKVIFLEPAEIKLLQVLHKENNK